MGVVVKGITRGTYVFQSQLLDLVDAEEAHAGFHFCFED